MPEFVLPDDMRQRWRTSLEVLAVATISDVARVVRVDIDAAGVIVGSGKAFQSVPDKLVVLETQHCREVIIQRADEAKAASEDAHGDKAYQSTTDGVSYLGEPILRSDGRVFGILELISRSPQAKLDVHHRLMIQSARFIEGELEFLYSLMHWRQRAVDLSTLRERLTLVNDVTGMGVWDYDIDRDVLVCDEACYRIYGLDPAKHTLSRIEDFKACVHPDDVERVTDSRLAGFNGASSDNTVEFRLVTPAGDVRWISSAARFLPQTESTPNRLVGMVMDITERRTAIDATQQNLESLRRAERLARIGSWTLDVATGKFACSDMLHELNGTDPAGPPLTSDDLSRMLPPESHAMVVAAVERCITTQEPYAFDALHYRPDGSTFPVQIRGHAVLDEDGRVSTLSGTVQDISERAEARERLEVLADNLPSGAIYRLERDETGSYRLTYVSAGIEKLIGISAQTIIADRNAFLRNIHPQDLPEYLMHVERSRREKTVFDHEFRAMRPDGSVIWMRCRSAPRNSSNGVVWDGVMFEVTKEHDFAAEMTRAKEAAEAGERAKADFLATMSHEIRTPMNTVIGMTRLVQQTELTPKQRNYLSKIDVSAKALLSIISDILDFSKIDAGMLALEDTEFELDEVLESVAAVTAMRAEEKGLEIAYSVAPDVPRRLRGDPVRLGQVINNLVTNAVKFTEIGEIVVTVKAGETGLDGKQTLAFSVRDTGIGLNQAQLASLFRPFAQAEAQTARRYGGTGLGLAICRKLLELMGGAIDVTSTPGRGSDFFFTVRMRAVPARARAGAVHRDIVLGGSRALIIDDNASARDILREMVAGFGVAVEAAASGPEGLTLLRDASTRGEAFDIVLMDWRMPGMDGLEVARLIRLEEKLARMPAVLMVTAYGREEVVQRVEQLKLQGLLIKPISQSVMFNTLMEILHGYDTSHQAGPAQAKPDKQTRAQALAGRKVLVVDDNALNCEVARDLLELVGVEVTTARNGLEAISALDTQLFDAVLMDVHMPVMDGLAATRAIRANPSWKRLPILALTAQARPEDRQAVAEAGMDAHLSKPIDDSQLYDALIQQIGDKTSLPKRHDTTATSSPLPEQPPLIDINRFYSRFGDNPELMHRILVGFQRDYGKAPDELRRMFEAGLWASLAELAHSLKGTIGYLADAHLEEAAGAIEYAARRDDCAGIAKDVELFAAELDRLLAEIPRTVAEHAGAVAPTICNRTLSMLVADARPMVEVGDYSAVSLLEQLQAAAAGSAHAAMADEALRCFGALDLMGALIALDRLAENMAPTRRVKHA